LVLSPDSKMVRNIKIGWKLTKLWKNCWMLKKIAKFKITEIENYGNLSTDLATKQPKFYRSL